MTAILVILGIVLYFAIGIFCGAFVGIIQPYEREMAASAAISFLWPLIMPILGVVFLFPYLINKTEEWMRKKIDERKNK